MSLWSRLSNAFRPPSNDEEIRDELEFHLTMDKELGQNDREARLRLGNPARIREEVREMHSIPALESLWSDVKHAIRRLSRDWQFAIAAVLILAFGIGVNTAIFTVVNALLLRPLAFPDSHRLVNLYQNVGERADPAGVSFPAYRDIAASTDAFSGVTAILPDDAQYQGPTGSQTVLVEYATSSFLDVLGYKLAAGRWFTTAEDRTGPEGAAVIGYRTWQTKFASDYGIIGQTIRINGAPVSVLGIGPAQLTSATHPALLTDFWLSMSAIAGVEADSFRAEILDRRGEMSFEVRARLKDGISVTQAQAAMDVVGRRLANDHPDTDPGKGIAVFPTDDVVIHPGEGDTLLALVTTIVMAIVALVLAIACSNLATLVLVRGSGRARELSVRLAIGATRWHLIRSFLAESVLLSLLGTAAGFVLSTWTLRYITALIPIRFDIQLDYRVLAFTLGLALATGIGFGLAPALRSTRIDLLAALRGESGSSLSLGKGWFTLKNALLVGQVAGSFFLLIGTAFFIRAVWSLQSQEPGFAVQGVALVGTNARYAGYGPAESQQIYRELQRRIAAIPGVQAVFATSGAPVGSSVGREIEVGSGSTWCSRHGRAGQTISGPPLSAWHPRRPRSARRRGPRKPTRRVRHLA